MDINFLKSLVGDVDATRPKLTDDQYRMISSMESNYYRAASRCAEMLAAKAVEKKEVNLRGISIKNQQVYDHYMQMAKLYDEKANLGFGYTDEDGKSLSSFASPFVGGVIVEDVKATKNNREIVQSVFPKKETDII